MTAGPPTRCPPTTTTTATATTAPGAVLWLERPRGPTAHPPSSSSSSPPPPSPPCVAASTPSAPFGAACPPHTRAAAFAPPPCPAFLCFERHLHTHSCAHQTPNITDRLTHTHTHTHTARAVQRLNTSISTLDCCRRHCLGETKTKKALGICDRVSRAACVQAMVQKKKGLGSMCANSRNIARACNTQLSARARAALTGHRQWRHKMPKARTHVVRGVKSVCNRRGVVWGGGGGREARGRALFEEAFGGRGAATVGVREVEIRVSGGICGRWWRDTWHAGKERRRSECRVDLWAVVVSTRHSDLHLSHPNFRKLPCPDASSKKRGVSCARGSIGVAPPPPTNSS